jgi:cytidylate kinase
MAIITISREMGTGAYQIAKDVAKKLKYTLVDGPKIAEVAPKFGITQELLERVDEKPPVYITAEDRLQAAYLNMVELILLDFAHQGNVILYGRGGQDLLNGLGSVLRLRFIAPFEERVESFAEREWLDPDLSRDLIRKSDHQRGGFIHFYFDRDWNDSLGYDLTINTSRFSQSAIVDTIVAAVRDTNMKNSEEADKTSIENIILCKRVETELLKSGKIESLHMKIVAEDGEVHLSGHVHTAEEHEAAVQLASKVQGVKAVHDNLQVLVYKRYKE